MGKLIAGGIIAIVIILVIGYLILKAIRNRYHQEDKRAGRALKGDLTAHQERTLIAHTDEAAALLRHLLAPPTELKADFSVLGDEDRVRAERWLHQHATLPSKGIKS